MTNEIIVAGNTRTAPTNEPDTSKEMNVTDGPIKPKVMVLAVHVDAAGGIVITPIDVEHEDDDQRDLSATELVDKKNLDETYTANDGPMKKALGALYRMFDQRLYRESFRTFENFCFALYGMHRIDEMTAIKAKARIKKLRAELEEEV